MTLTTTATTTTASTTTAATQRLAPAVPVDARPVDGTATQAKPPLPARTGPAVPAPTLALAPQRKDGV